MLDGEFAEVGGFGSGVFEVDGGDAREEECRAVLSFAAVMGRMVRLWCRGRSCLMKRKGTSGTKPCKTEADQTGLEC